MSGENTLQEKELSSAQTSLSQEKMFQIMQTHFAGRNFFKGGSFDREIFKKIITEIDWKK